jgi:hypothetical protein
MSNSEAYIIGGEDSSSKPLNVVEKLTPAGMFYSILFEKKQYV